MTLPAIREIRRGFPNAALTLLLSKEVQPLIEGHPDVARLFAWDRQGGIGWAETLRWALALRKERFDAAIIFNPTRQFHVAAFLAGIPVRIGYRRKWGFLLTRSIPDTKASRTLHESGYNLELASLFGIRTLGAAVLSLPIHPEAEAEAERILGSHGVPPSSRPIALHPWTGNFSETAHRRWPLESFRALALSLQGCGRPILVIGAPEFIPLMEPWKAGGISWIRNLVGHVPLKTLPALLRRCALLVSNDSGPVHVAAAVDTATIVVASKSQAPVLKRWGPQGPEHRILLAPTVEEVAAAVRARMEERCGS